MAKYGPSSVGSFIANGRSLAGTLTQITFKKIGATENTDALGDSWQESTPTGRLSGELYQTGWFDDAANSSVAAFVGSETTSQVVTINPAGSAAGRVVGFDRGEGVGEARRIDSAAFADHGVGLRHARRAFGEIVGPDCGGNVGEA